MSERDLECIRIDAREALEAEQYITLDPVDVLAILASIAAAREDARVAKEHVLSLEHIVVTWGVDCEHCAQYLDSGAAETFRAEKAERQRDQAAARVAALAAALKTMLEIECYLPSMRPGGTCNTVCHNDARAALAAPTPPEQPMAEDVPGSVCPECDGHSETSPYLAECWHCQNTGRVLPPAPPHECAATRRVGELGAALGRIAASYHFLADHRPHAGPTCPWETCTQIRAALASS